MHAVGQTWYAYYYVLLSYLMTTTTIHNLDSDITQEAMLCLVNTALVIVTLSFLHSSNKPFLLFGSKWNVRLRQKNSSLFE